MAAKAGRLQVQMEMDVAQIKRDMASLTREVKNSSQQWKKDLDGFASGMKSAFTNALAGGAIVAALSASVKTVLGMFDQIADGAKKLGVTAEAFQELDYVAKQTGTSMEELTTTFARMQKNIGEAQGGGAKAFVAGLESIGLALDDLKGKTPDEQFKTLVAQLGNVEDPAKRAAAGAALFGKSFAQLGPMMAEGADGMDALIKRAHELGIVMSDEAVAAGEAFNDELDTMRLAVLGVIGEAIGPALPVFQQMITEIMNVATASGDAGTELLSFGDVAKVVAGIIVDMVAAARNLGAAFVWAGQQIGLSMAAANVRIEGLQAAWAQVKENAKDPFSTTRTSPLTVLAEAEKKATDLIKDSNKEVQATWESTRKAIEEQRLASRQAIADVQYVKPTPPTPTPGTGGTEDNTAATEANTKAKKANKEATEKLSDAERQYQKDVQDLKEITNAITAELMKQSGVKEQDAELWRLIANGATDTQVQIAKATQEFDSLREINERNTQATKDYETALVDLTSEQMRANGSTEEAIRLYRQQALAYTEAEKRADDAEAQVRKASDANRKRAQEAADMQQTIQRGVEDMFTSIITGSGDALDAIKQLLAQMLAVWATQKALGWLGLSGATPAANGMAFAGNGVRFFSQGGIVSSPTPFTFGGGQLGVMGEADPEAIMPLARGANGKLGVRGGGVSVNVHNYAGASIETQADGDKLDIIVRQVKDSLATDVLRGGNPFATSLERTYSVRR